MSEEIISKRCPKCKQIKPLESGFDKCHSRKDGHQGHCKTCRSKYMKKYRQTEEGKVVSRKAAKCYARSEKGKAHIKNYIKSNQGKAKIRRYNQSEKRKAANKRYRQSKKGKITNKRWQQSEKCKKYHKNYQQTEKYKQIQKESIAKYRKKYPERVKAHQIVNDAIKAGKLPRPDTLQCHYCPAQAKDYHHHKGYAPEHWLDVVPACRKCHGKFD